MSKLDVMLMYPNFKWADWTDRTMWSLHPYNLGILAAMIRDKCGVRIVDGTIEDLSKEEFYKIINTEKPDVLGISILTNEYGKAGSITAKIAKEAHPKIKTIMGGVHATSLPLSVIQDPNVDYVVAGEGEYVFKELCDSFREDGNLPEKGILFKKNGRIINRGRSDFIQDLDAIPFPAYQLVDFKRYTTKIQREAIERPRAIPFTHMITSRGCPFNCSFCEVKNISGKKARLRSVENILRETEWLIKDYGIKGLIYDDDNLLIDKNRAKILFRAMIDRKYNLKWTAPALAVYKLDEEMIELMKESGCEYVAISIESGVKRVLKELINKPLDLDYAQKMIKKLRDCEIGTVANFIVGFPNETWQEIRKTLEFAELLDVDYIRINTATPLPNTRLYKTAKEKGYLVKGFSFDQHLWGQGWIETSEFRPQDLRILVAYEWDRINFTNPNRKRKIAKMMDITEERLNQIRKETLKGANP